MLENNKHNILKEIKKKIEIYSKKRNIETENIDTAKKKLLHQLKNNNKQIEAKSLFRNHNSMSQNMKNELILLRQ